MIRRWPAPGPLVLLAALVTSAACTLLVDSKVRQCQGNADCARFGEAVCDPQQWVCVPAPAHPAGLPDAAASVDAGAPVDAAPMSGAPDAAPACRGPSGCWSCAPKSDPDFLNGCTDGRCVPFDNRARLTNLSPEGALRPLP